MWKIIPSSSFEMLQTVSLSVGYDKGSGQIHTAGYNTVTESVLTTGCYVLLDHLQNIHSCHRPAAISK
jgi:hypothetical protein